jgi:ABC-2 type transport system permease protein
MMRAILALAQKDLLILVRLRSGIFFTIVWPLLIAIFFGLIFSGSNEPSAKIGIAVVDEDRSPAAGEFIAKLETSKEFEVIRADRDQATKLVRQGKRTAAIMLPPGFGEASGRIFYGTPRRLEVWIDPSRRAESAMISGLLFKQAAEDMQKLMSDRSSSRNMVRKAMTDLNSAPDTDEAKGTVRRFLGELDHFLDTAPSGSGGQQATAQWQPLEIQEKPVTSGNRGPHPDNSFGITFPQGILWGIIGCVMTFGIGIVSERTQGTLVRLQMSPISRRDLLAGKALACFAAIAVVQVALFLLGRFFFQVRPSSWLLLILAGFSTAIAFVGIMMLIAALGKTEQAAAGAGWAVMMPIAMFGGGMVPLFVMPAWMSTAGNFSPAKWAILALEGAIWRGFSFQEMLLPCGILVLVGIVCFAVGTRAFRPAS